MGRKQVANPAFFNPCLNYNCANRLKEDFDDQKLKNLQYIMQKGVEFRKDMQTFKNREEKIEVEQIVLRKRGIEHFSDHESLLDNEDFVDSKR